jgi:phage-related protein
VNITDKDVLSSLEKAERAQDTADGKRRVFVSQPVPPYDPGDLWVNATYPTSPP